MKTWIAALALAARALGLLAGLVGLAAAAMAQLGRLDNRWGAAADAFTHLAPVWLGLGGLCLVIALALRGWLLKPGLLVGLAVTVAASSLVLPELLAPRIDRQGPASGPTLKLVQFNVWQSNQDPAATLAWIKAQNADVVVAEETDGLSRPIDAALQAAYPNWTSCSQAFLCSVMVYSRLPILDNGSDWGPPTAWSRFLWQGRPITVVGIHYAWPFPPGFQRFQARRLTEFLAAQPRDDLILSGDFNSTPWSFAMKRADRDFGLQRRTHALWSWPARWSWPGRIFPGAGPIPPFPFVPIDQVFAGANWKTISVERGPRLGSDHYPVVIVLQRRR